MTSRPSPLLSYRGFYGSALHLPDPALLTALRGLRPFFLQLYDGTILSQQTDRGQITVQDNSWLIALVASSSQAAGFVASFYDTKRQQIFETDPIRFGNSFGTAQKPFYLKKPYLLPNLGQVQSRVINLAAATNAIQIIGLAYWPDPRRPIT